jgi:hypothetical protein
VNGEKEVGRGLGANAVTLVIGEAMGDRFPLPVYGERMPAGR